MNQIGPYFPGQKRSCAEGRDAADHKVHDYPDGAVVAVGQVVDGVAGCLR